MVRVKPVRFVKLGLEKGCTPRARGIRWFGSELQLCRPVPGEKDLTRSGLPLSGYRPAVQDCDSWTIAYMLCSINATKKEELPYKPERTFLALVATAFLLSS